MGLHAGLSCPYVEAGLGPAQAIGEIARSGHSLEKTVASKALALEALLPHLTSTGLMRCHHGSPGVHLHPYVECRCAVCMSGGVVQRATDAIACARVQV